MGRFFFVCDWITYEENDKHAACVASVCVCVCAMGRSPGGKQAALCHKLSCALWVTELGIVELGPLSTRQSVAHGDFMYLKK